MANNNPTGINQYTRIGGNRGGARTTQQRTKARSAANVSFARDVMAKRPQKGKVFSAKAYNKAAAGFVATQTRYRKAK